MKMKIFSRMFGKKKEELTEESCFEDYAIKQEHNRNVQKKIATEYLRLRELDSQHLHKIITSHRKMNFLNKIFKKNNIFKLLQRQVNLQQNMINALSDRMKQIDDRMNDVEIRNSGTLVVINDALKRIETKIETNKELNKSKKNDRTKRKN